MVTLILLSLLNETNLTIDNLRKYKVYGTWCLKGIKTTLLKKEVYLE